MHVPEATLNFDDLPVLGQYDVRFSGQVRKMEAEPISELVQESSYDKLWFCVLVPDSGHVAVSLFCRKDVGHDDSDPRLAMSMNWDRLISCFRLSGGY